MISVIIPLMPIMPYKEQVDVCIESIMAQEGVDVEIIVSKHEPEKWIKKNELLNTGIWKSKGEIICFCDADFVLEDVTLLARMQKKLYEDDLDVIYQMFISTAGEPKNKIADGGPFMTRSILEAFGELDESHLGISMVTFPLLEWVMDNAKWYCGPEFMVGINKEPFVRKLITKINWDTRMRINPCFKRTLEKLKTQGLWPM